MFNSIEVLRMAHGMASHAAERQTLIARNIANADTPEYRALDMTSFADGYQAAANAGLHNTSGRHLRALNDAPITKTEVFAIEGGASPNGNTVSLEFEMMKSAETMAQHQMAQAVYKSALNILRQSISG
ncbi:hypothetical protein ACMU_02275 [Actibacterium mucosum KCTC 23349]|uniref:Flagellar basal body rod protein FlgB n=1 Tax=Actibacterium mucosum KCTC 23349 TaxID=1454373 RepID=A0A037ZMN0_9RHOB|nr:FlgB family protein [Actibacterium mucosum]KAJ57349.1 hypothetical protein ACMU_02275 [Actibacterium mucosum KCTC 23349]